MNSHLTAISRNALPVPTRWLLASGMIHGQVLDYGCGKCSDLNNNVLAKIPGIQCIHSYDPHYAPKGKITPQRKNEEGWYDVILCTYVLCTLPATDEHKVLTDVQRHLRPNGVAYVTVRNDEPKGGYGYSAKGTFQRLVKLPYLYELRRTATYSIYLLKRGDTLPKKWFQH